MTEEILKRGNEIQKDIKKLDYFISVAEMLWTGKLSIRKPKMFFASVSYGAIRGEEIELDTELKNEVLQVLKNKRDRLVKELELLN